MNNLIWKKHKEGIEVNPRNLMEYLKFITEPGGNELTMQPLDSTNAAPCPECDKNTINLYQAVINVPETTSLIGDTQCMFIKYGICSNCKEYVISEIAVGIDEEI